ncbi:hypothetical protein GLOIN_2v1766278 [Rhizophagus irregularis DAOM 181602=DAOM 197198]|nr:hypothetical protein GLOIN_2v1766278 [Rhizophagus irregularis DAOM 181602=DAOM 197198]
MSGRNLARRGGGSYNPNSNKAARQEKKNNKKQLSDNSGSDSDNTSQKRSRIITKDSMDEDYEDFVADAPADGGLVGSTSTAIPQQNNSRSTAQENTQASTPNNSAAPTAPGQDASSGTNASIHAPRNKENNSSPNASLNMDETDGTSPDQAVDPSPTITINRQDFLAAAAPNSAPQTLELLKTNKAIIDTVNNLFLETYESYTGRARMTGSGDAKRLIIHFHTAEARDLCVGSTHSIFPDLQFHLYDPKQLRSDEDLRAIQVTDIPFFITKPQLQSYFKKFGNLLALHLYSRKGAKMQQARIVYDHADAISRFTTQWAVYCFSTCLRVTPCHYSLEQKAARRAFVAVLSGLPANTKNIHLAPLVKEHGAKAINIPLSLNSYKPKPWAYVTFNSQETMDAAMEQTIGFQGRTLRWVHPTIRKLFATVVVNSVVLLLPVHLINAVVVHVHVTLWLLLKNASILAKGPPNKERRAIILVPRSRSKSGIILPLLIVLIPTPIVLIIIIPLLMLSPPPPLAQLTPPQLLMDVHLPATVKAKIDLFPFRPMLVLRSPIQILLVPLRLLSTFSMF